MERSFSILPFSIGCVSHSSVSVASDRPRGGTHLAPPPPPPPPPPEDEEKTRSHWGFQWVTRRFKGLSQMLIGYREEEEEEEEEREMVIGFPTDVQHVGHIGWDGSNMKKKPWKNMGVSTPPDLFSLPSISLDQFEISISQQAQQQLSI